MKGPGLSTAIAGIGLALSAWLSILKVWALPCVGGGCETVIQSSWGSVLGVPVGIYGVALWLGVFFAPGRARYCCLGILALGSVGFTGLQAFVLRSFCPYCLAHSLAAWCALGMAGVQPRRWGAYAAVAAVAAALSVTLALASRPPAGGRPALASFAREQPEALYWLGPRDAESPALVLSMDCPACLDKLSALTGLDFSHHPNGPALYFKTDARQREATGVFVGAVLAQPGDRREAFLAIASLVLSQRDLLLGDPGNAAGALRMMLPNAASREAEASALLARQSQQLQAARIETTPLLVTPDGTARTSFHPEDVFPRPLTAPSAP